MSTKAENITVNIRTAIVIVAVALSTLVSVGVTKQNIETQLAVEHAALETIQNEQREIKDSLKDIDGRVKSLEENYIRMETKWEAWTN